MTPGVNGPKLAGVPSDSDSVAGTVPLTVPAITSAFAVSFGAQARVVTVYALPGRSATGSG